MVWDVGEDPQGLCPAHPGETWMCLSQKMAEPREPICLCTQYSGCSGEQLGTWGWGRALESRLRTADVVLAGGGSAAGHEKSLPCSGINKGKLPGKLVCPGTALLWGRPGVWEETGDRLGTVTYPRSLSTPKL